VVETRRRPQRTQAERSAETQAALLDATIASLVEVGYARTSTTEIVRRAGVSRGAQVHHYPAKADLVVAAVERVFAAQEQAFSQTFAALPVAERTLERAVDLLWDIFGGPAYPATLELVVAARTDPELQVVVQAVGTRFERTVAELFDEYFPELRHVPAAAHLAAFAFAVLQGAAISGYAGFGRPDEVVGVLRSLARLATADLLTLLERMDDAPRAGS
ncbi:MAG TPA: TetR/AcrR family transcriptional regulator, partial [Acidimicrobiales bacterium]